MGLAFSYPKAQDAPGYRGIIAKHDWNALQEILSEGTRSLLTNGIYLRPDETTETKTGFAPLRFANGEFRTEELNMDSFEPNRLFEFEYQFGPTWHGNIDDRVQFRYQKLSNVKYDQAKPEISAYLKGADGARLDSHDGYPWSIPMAVEYDNGTLTSRGHIHKTIKGSVPNNDSSGGIAVSVFDGDIALSYRPHSSQYGVNYHSPTTGQYNLTAAISDDYSSTNNGLLSMCIGENDIHLTAYNSGYFRYNKNGQFTVKGPAGWYNVGTLGDGLTFTSAQSGTRSGQWWFHGTGTDGGRLDMNFVDWEQIIGIARDGDTIYFATFDRGGVYFYSPYEGTLRIRSSNVATANQTTVLLTVNNWYGYSYRFKGHTTPYNERATFYDGKFYFLHPDSNGLYEYDTVQNTVTYRGYRSSGAFRGSTSTNGITARGRLYREDKYLISPGNGEVGVYNTETGVMTGLPASTSHVNTVYNTFTKKFYQRSGRYLYELGEAVTGTSEPSTIGMRKYQDPNLGEFRLYLYIDGTSSYLGHQGIDPQSTHVYPVIEFNGDARIFKTQLGP